MPCLLTYSCRRSCLRKIFGAEFCDCRGDTLGIRELDLRLCVAEAKNEIQDEDRNVDGDTNWLMEAKVELVNYGRVSYHRV